MTPERAKAIRGDLPQDVYNIAGPVLGPNFTKDKFPLTGEFIAKVVKDAGFGVGPVKQKYMKATPVQVQRRTGDGVRRHREVDGRRDLSVRPQHDGVRSRADPRHDAAVQARCAV